MNRTDVLGGIVAASDTGSTSSCAGACAQVWPPLLAGNDAPATTGAAQAALLGTTQRTDGARQVTYDDHPLYYFAGDKAAGDTTGQGLQDFGGGWYVLSPDGTTIDTADEAPAAPAPGHGY